MNAKQLDDPSFEALFRQAVIDAYIEEIDAIPSRKKLQEIVTFSPEFESKMKKLILNERRKDYLQNILTYIKKTVAVIIVVTTLIFGILLFSPDVRADVKNTVIEWYDKFTSFIFQRENPDIKKYKEWRPKYIPEGYLEIGVERMGNGTNIEYANDEGTVINFSYRPDGNDTTINVDNENHTIESKTINGYNTFIIKAKKDDFENGVIWKKGGYTFYIWSILPVDELIKVMQSIYDN